MSKGYPSDWDSRRESVYQRDDFTCQNCGRKGGPYGDYELHAHHVVPKSKGGTHKKSNLKTLCKQCHNAIHGSKSAPTSKERSRSTTNNESKVKKYSVKNSPFDGSRNWRNVNPNQTHIEVCPECGSETVWFAKLGKTRYLKCGSCSSEWKREKQEVEKKGWIFTRTVKELGWREIKGPNQGKFQSKAEWKVE